MRGPPLRPTVVLLLACLLAVLLFLLALALPGAHFWGSYLLPIVVVFLWGRRRDIYVVTAVASVLVIAGFWFGGTSPTPTYFVINHLLPLGVLWGVAWLLAQRHQMQDELARQRQELVHQQQVLEEQVAARTAELRASEHKYRDLFDDSPDMYVAATAGDHIIRECNLTLARTLGYSREELIGRPAAMLLTRASYTAGRAYWPAYVAAGSLANLEVQLQCKDGTVLDVLGSGHYHPATDGQPAYSHVTFHDITERKRSEERLREALQRLQLATDVAGIGIWNWHIADGNLEWDDRTCDLYAVPPDQRRTGLSYDLWRARPAVIQVCYQIAGSAPIASCCPAARSATSSRLPSRCTPMTSARGR